jgi:PAS domain S-box-containing protein
MRKSLEQLLERRPGRRIVFLECVGFVFVAVTFWLTEWYMPPFNLRQTSFETLVIAVLGVFIVRRTWRAENALRESEERFRVIAASNPDHVLVQDRDLKYSLVINPQLGLTEHEMIGKTDYDFLSKEDADNLTKIKRQVLETGQPAHMEVPLLSRTGEREFFSGSYVPKFDARGRVDGLIGYFKNVTERKKAEEALQQLNAQLEQRVAEQTSEIRGKSAYNRSLIDASLDPLVTIGPDGKITDVNAASEQATGFSRNELIGNDFSRYFTDPQKARAGYRQVFKDGLVRDYALEIRHRDGHTTPVLYNAVVYRDEAGTVTGVFAAARDITEARKAQAELKDINATLEQRVAARTAELAESREQLVTVFRASPTGIFVTRLADGSFLEANDAYLRITGYSAEELTGHTSVELNLWVNPEDRNRIVRMIREHSRIDNFEVQFRRKSGEIVDLLASALPLERGGELCILGTLTDITERKQQEKELLKLNRTLKALSDNNQAIMRTRDEREYLDEACQIIAKDCGYAMVWIGYKENDKGKSVRPVAHAGFEAGYLETLNITWADTERGRGPTGMAIRTGKPCVCTNMLTDPKFAPWREQAVKRGYASSVVLPLLDERNAFGAVSLYSKQPDSFSTAEVELLTELAVDLAFGITTLRLRKEKLLDEEKIKSLARFPEENPSAVLRVLTDGSLAYANPASSFLLNGLGSGEKDKAPEVLMKLVLNAFASQKTIETDVVCRDRTFVITCTPFPDSGYVNIYGRDVTDRRAAEQSLTESEQRYRSLFAGMSEGFALHEIICDKNGEPVDYRFIDVNPAFEKLTGLKRNQVVGKRVMELMPETERIWVENYGRVALSGEPCHFESFSADLKRWYEVYAYRPFRGQFAVFFMDVTDKRRTQEREREAAALAAASRTAVDTLESVGEGVLLTNMEGRILSVNPALERMSGYPAAEAAGKQLEDLIPQVVAEEDRAAALETMRRSLRGEAGGIKTFTLIGNGGRVPIILGVSFIRNAEGKPTAVVTTMRDISEIHAMQKRHQEEAQRYEKHLRSMAATLASTEEQERRRIAGHIHDTIIQSLSLSRIRLGSVLKNLRDAGRMEEAKIIDGVRTLIDEGITQSRLTMSDLRPPLLYELGLGPALEELADKLGRQHQVSIKVQYKDLPQSMGQALRGLLFQSARELIMNALKHSGSKNIEIALDRTDHVVKLDVEDHGAGFSVSDLDDIHKDSQHGFGLFNIRERLHGYGGKLEVRSIPGSGTMAAIEVPLEGES